jgi:hypothetical protein
MKMNGEKNTDKMYNNSARDQKLKLIYVKITPGSFPDFCIAQ